MKYHYYKHKGIKNREFVLMTFFITTWKNEFWKTSGTIKEFYFLMFIIDLNSPNIGKMEEAGGSDGGGGHYHGSLKAGNNG